MLWGSAVLWGGVGAGDRSGEGRRVHKGSLRGGTRMDVPSAAHAHLLETMSPTKRSPLSHAELCPFSPSGK